MAVTGQTDSSATVSLTVIGQSESLGVGTTAQRGAEVDIATSGSSAAEAATRKTWSWLRSRLLDWNELWNELIDSSGLWSGFIDWRELWNELIDLSEFRS